MAMTSVCRYLVSDNVATLLHFWIRNAKNVAAWTDAITCLLLLISVLFLIGLIMNEFSETALYEKLCVSKQDTEDEYTEHLTASRTQSRGQYGSS